MKRTTRRILTVARVQRGYAGQPGPLPNYRKSEAGTLRKKPHTVRRRIYKLAANEIAKSQRQIKQRKRSS